MKRLSYIVLIITLFPLSSYSQEKKHSQVNIECKTCHACEVPTKNDPCLLSCPRFMMIKEFPSPEIGPDIVIIDELANRYTPVVFSHKIHAQMSEMTGGCITCHHYNTLGPVLSCNKCHSRDRKREEISSPDLKGAYHQQCMNCHRQWSRETECSSCHQEKNEGESQDITKITSQLVMKTHPEVKEPTKIVYETEYDKGKLVTFFHNDHTNLFGINCTSCHENENCIRCHDVEKNNYGDNGFYESPIKVKYSETERHKRCFSCHQNDNCSNCHKNGEMKPFNHGTRAGWPLKQYHQNLQCESCHLKSMTSTGLDSKCGSCHEGWNPETFNHKIVGLVLDENHIDNECEDCHTENDFSKAPTCDNCHDNKNYPKDKPGKVIIKN